MTAGFGDIWYQLALLLALALGSHFLVTRFRQPVSIFVILIGIVVGPTALGFVTDLGAVALFAQLGAVVLLFYIGLETNLREVYTTRTILIALGGVLVPWFAGVFFGVLIGENFAVSMFLGATLTATSLAVTADILMEMKKLDTQIGKTIIGAACVDDVLGMIMLSVSLGLSEADVQVREILVILVVAVLFIIFGGFVAGRYISKVVLFIERHTTRVEHSWFLFAIAMMFLYAFIAEAVGISAIVGAFIAGTLFSGVPMKKELHTGTKFLSSLFAPMFFISIGIMVNLHGLFTIEFLLLALTFTFLAIITKVVGCALPARLFRMQTNDAVIVGFGMAPRAEVALAIAVTGLSLGIIGQTIYSIVVLMAILTTVIVAPIVRIFMVGNEK